MKKHIKSVVVLTSICALVAILMSITNYFTEPIIEKRRNETANAALLEVFPDGKGFSEIDIAKYDLPESITKAYSEESGGYVFEMNVTGYKSGLVIMCGISADGTVTGATYLQSAETNGAEKTYGEKLKGATLDSIDGIDTVAGSTKTTVAYRNAVKDALGAKVILEGGSADLRTEEEIFADNLNTALSAGEGKFTPYLITEQLSADYSVYKADNDAGYVFVTGDSFVGVDASGNVVSDTAEELKTSIAADAKILLASKKTEIDLTSYAESMPSSIEKAYKTESGNYVFNIHASGYGKKGDKYSRSNEYIYIDVAVTKDGKILSCITVSQKESEGIGDACAKESYYGQYDGKTADNYTEVDSISGATVTSNGYMSAISNVFEAVKVLEGK